MKNKIIIAMLNYLAKKLQKKMHKYKTHFQIMDINKLSELEKINTLHNIKMQVK